MKTIAFFSSKGGSGKSTGAMGLASTLAYHYGKRVLMISTDPQHTPLKVRNEEIMEIESLLDSEDPLDKEKGKELNAQLANAYDIIDTDSDDVLTNLFPARKEMATQDHVDYLIVDTIGTLQANVINTMKESDLVLVPVKLARPDLSEFFSDISAVVRESILNEGTKSMWYPSEYDKRTSEYREFFRDVSDFEESSGIPCMLPGLVARQDLKRISTVSFPDEESKVREVLIEFTDTVINQTK
ncbi:AAA family ATPase [Ekhidna sp. MALMAid0563]|uniref:AAA family ATPase n=1 Tax=Ekhidna sp. MALMAid0563 TaxID=3143937 RepID=UPI0032DFE3CE